MGNFRLFEFGKIAVYVFWSVFRSSFRNNLRKRLRELLVFLEVARHRGHGGGPLYAALEQGRHHVLVLAAGACLWRREAVRLDPGGLHFSYHLPQLGGSC